MSGEAAIEFECPSCQKITRVPASYGGRRGKCPKCGFVLEVPTAEPDPAPVPARRPPPGDLAARPAPDDAGGDQKPCRYCGESIATKAVKCRHCGEWLDGRVRAAKESERVDAGGPHIVLRIWGVLLMGLAGVNLLMIIAAAANGGASAFGGLLGVLIGFRVGLGVFRGERQAVGCLIALVALAVLMGVFALSSGGREGPFVAAGVFVISAVFYGPPIVIGVLNWSKLT